jgi:ferric-dicitrate binding protein FerR (iron transport regulator)
MFEMTQANPRQRRKAPARQPDALDVASAWLVRRASASEAEAQAFEAWLAQAPRHRDAWAKAQDLWRLLGDALSDAD